jgi:SagB-type dehydrogenase family enzyme
MTRHLLLATLALSMLAVPDPARGARPAGPPPATEAQTLALPRPDLEGKIPLEKVLGQRRSVREYAPGALTLAEAAQLLWAAQGITSPEGKRTTPSARAVYPLQVYLVAAEVTGLAPGVYRYEPKSHALALVTPGDPGAAMAKATPRQDWIARSPAVVVVVGDSALAAQKFGARAERWVALETGCVVQDVFLEATALGLGTVMVGGFEDAALRSALGLPSGWQPFAVMPVGRRK